MARKKSSAKKSTTKKSSGGSSPKFGSPAWRAKYNLKGGRGKKKSSSKKK